MLTKEGWVGRAAPPQTPRHLIAAFMTTSFNATNSLYLAMALTQTVTSKRFFLKKEAKTFLYWRAR